MNNYNTTNDFNKIYYNSDKMFSYNVTRNIVMSERGTGKTFEFKTKCIKQKDEFIWVRRKFENEMSELIANNAYKWCTDLYSNGILKTDDDVSMEKDLFLLNQEPKGHFIPLSTSLGKKGNNYDNVSKIIFDEFLIREDGRANKYLKNEIYLLENLYETVNRSRDSIKGLPPVKLIMLANKEGIFNPYFSEWKITPFTERFKKFKVGNTEVLVENYENPLFHKLKLESEGGKAVTGTRHGLSMVENKFWEGDLVNIKQRPTKAVLKYNIKMGESFYGIWYDTKNFYISEKYNPAQDIFAVKEDLESGLFILSKRSSLGMLLKTQFEYDRIFFEDVNIKNHFIIMMNQLRSSIY